jgi:hypothetical protein
VREQHVIHRTGPEAHAQTRCVGQHCTLHARRGVDEKRRKMLLKRGLQVNQAGIIGDLEQPPFSADDPMKTEDPTSKRASSSPVSGRRKSNAPCALKA